MSTFYFKHFAIRQSHAAMKVGTDALLLGSLAEFNHPSSLLDLGAGTGVLSLMIAQRYPGIRVIALECDSQACADARFNFEQGAFPTCSFELVETDLRVWQSETTFDAIISNPPYFGNSFKSQNTSRNTARHTDDTLTFSELVHCAARYLSEKGLFWVVLPDSEKTLFVELCQQTGLYLQKIISINGKPNHAVRVIMAFSRKQEGFRASTLTVRDNNGNYTSEYIQLTRDYHAKDLSANESAN